MLRANSLPTVGLGPKLDRSVATETRQQTHQDLAGRRNAALEQAVVLIDAAFELLLWRETKRPTLAAFPKAVILNHRTYFQKLCKHNSCLKDKNFYPHHLLCTSQASCSRSDDEVVRGEARLRSFSVIAPGCDPHRSRFRKARATNVEAS